MRVATIKRARGEDLLRKRGRVEEKPEKGMSGLGMRRRKGKRSWNEGRELRDSYKRLKRT
eukprot:5820025-Karenia_brevis.AAC.1